MFFFRFYLVLMMVNQSLSRPVLFDTFKQLINENVESSTHISEQATAQITTETSTQGFFQATKETKDQTLFERLPWLDNAIEFLLDRLYRIVIVLIKKFVFKMPVHITDFI